MSDAEFACKKGMVLLVRSYDRLFRDLDKGMYFRACLERRGVRIKSLTEEAADAETSTGKLIQAIVFWAAEQERGDPKGRGLARFLDWKWAPRGG